MADDPDLTDRAPAGDATDHAARIDAALGRIESAIAARAAGTAALGRRHAALKARMAEAVSALDEVIARTPQAPGEAS